MTREKQITAKGLDVSDKPINKKEIVLMLDMMMTVWTIHTKCINDNFDSRDIKDFKVIKSIEYNPKNHNHNDLIKKP